MRLASWDVFLGTEDELKFPKKKLQVGLRMLNWPQKRFGLLLVVGFLYVKTCLCTPNGFLVLLWVKHLNGTRLVKN